MINPDNVLKQIFRTEAVVSLGCTEPGSIAFICSVAKKEVGIDATIKKITVTANLGILKNAFGVTIPGTNEKGPAIAAALGAICGNPDLGLEALRYVSADDIRMAKQMVEIGQVEVICRFDWQGLRIESVIESDKGYGYAVIDGGHANVVFHRRSDMAIVLDDLHSRLDRTPSEKGYADKLRKMTLADMVRMAESIDHHDRLYIDQGVTMNNILSMEGHQMGGVGRDLWDLSQETGGQKGTIAKAQMIVASATDARMAGIPKPAWSSGGSGNQGILASLVPYFTGLAWGIDKPRIQESIAFSQLINSYIKCYLGDLSAMCGCAVAAGVGAAGALVYLRTKDVNVINMAINNVIADIAGMLCDGAKGGCARKGATATEVAIRSALLALKGKSVDIADGIIGGSFELTVINLARVGRAGMNNCDAEVFAILSKK